MRIRAVAPILDAATRVLLVLLLFLQAGCTAAVGPPTPIRPADPEQLRAIEEAAEVRARTRSGRTRWLRDPVVADSQLRGRSTETLPARELSIPLDSIVEVQLYEAAPVQTAVVSLVGVTAVLWLFGSMVWTYDPFE